ncbi:unnamed protein product, partial [Mesorhabditis belari]|uniref:Deacetylase sirtuin-type domain-containing protein n=1 Tax=Mesorhabditis belari TaxID=2138241 RepID=A0AAF3JA72_9BILA
MSSPGGSRQRKNNEGKADGKRDETEQKSDDERKKEQPKAKHDTCSKLPDVFNKFVDSFNSALHAVVDQSATCSSRKLRSLTIEGVVEFIKTEKPKNIIVMTGAGISTSAGIPDFRSPGSGLYDNLQKYDLPSPEAIFQIDFFEKNPEPFFTLAKELFPEDLKPTPCHYFIRMLEKKGLLRRWYTQNIDSLEYLTGLPEDKVVTAHGNHHTSTCRKCSTKYDLGWITAKLKDKSCKVPHCEKLSCGGVVKPDIIFFGEALPRRFFHCAIQDFPQCDLLLIFGTSLVVQPFASMVNEVDAECPRLLVNLEAVGRASRLEEMIGTTGLCYGRDGNTRDVFWKGSCDEGARKMADLLGWDAELDILIEQGPIPLSKAK